MRVVVTTNTNRQYSNYRVLKTLHDVTKLSEVEYVIVNTYSDADISLGSIVSELRKKFNCHFFYITAEPRAVMQLLLNGVSGIYLEDEFYLDDEVELDCLIDSYQNDCTDLVVSDTQSNLTIVKNFMTAYARGEECCSLPYYISQTNYALAELEAESMRKDLQIKEMGTSALEVFERASGYIAQLEKSSKLASQQLAELTRRTETPRSRFGGITYFPTVKYNPPPTKKVIVVKEYSPCRYLTSFLLSYMNYLKIMRNKRVKLIFTVQKGVLIYTKYSSDIFTFISQESIGKTNLYENEIIATNVPMSNSLINMVSSGSYDVIIVVDRLYGEVILQGNNIKQISAVSGETDLKRYNLNPRNCIFSHITYPNELVHIPTIKGYPPATARDRRVAIYSQICNQLDLYTKLDNYLDIDLRR